MKKIVVLLISCFSLFASTSYADNENKNSNDEKTCELHTLNSNSGKPKKPALNPTIIYAYYNNGVLELELDDDCQAALDIYPEGSNLPIFSEFVFSGENQIGILPSGIYYLTLTLDDGSVFYGMLEL